MRHILFQTARSRKGLTLAELAAVLAVVAILMALAIPALGAELRKSQELVCQGNRRSAEAELELANARDPASDLQALLEQYKTSCPGGGVYSLGERDDLIALFCTVHGGDIVEDLFYRYTELGKNAKENQEFLDKYKWVSNDNYRRFILDTDKAWATLTYNRNVYYIQPYIYIASTPIPPDPFVFASVHNVITSNWNAKLLYYNGVWYYYVGKGVGDMFGVANKTLADMVEIVKTGNWVALSPNDYVIKPPDPDNPPQ